MERTFHMLLYRAFHAQRNQLRPCIGRIGLEVGQPKILTYLARMDPARKSSWRTILRSIRRPFPACSTRWKRAGSSPAG